MSVARPRIIYSIRICVIFNYTHLFPLFPPPKSCFPDELSKTIHILSKFRNTVSQYLQSLIYDELQFVYLFWVSLAMLNGGEGSVVSLEGESALLTGLASICDGFLVHLHLLPAHHSLAALVCKLLGVSVKL